MGVIITIINYDLVELLSFLGCSSFCYGVCSRVGNSAGAFVMTEASSSAVKTSRILKIISRILGNFSDFSASENENREFSLVLGNFREKNSRFEL